MTSKASPFTAPGTSELREASENYITKKISTFAKQQAESRTITEPATPLTPAKISVPLIKFTTEEEFNEEMKLRSSSEKKFVPSKFRISERSGESAEKSLRTYRQHLETFPLILTQTEPAAKFTSQSITPQESTKVSFGGVTPSGGKTPGRISHAMAPPKMSPKRL
jgi:hypothetical protein